MRLTKLQNKILRIIGEGLDPVPSSLGIEETNHVEKEGFYTSRKSLVKKGLLNKLHQLTPLGWQCYRDRYSLGDSRTEPDWYGYCDVCGASPIVPITGLCGVCTFGDADAASGEWQ